jgi:hypothetical protein
MDGAQYGKRAKRTLPCHIMAVAWLDANLMKFSNANLGPQDIRMTHFHSFQSITWFGFQEHFPIEFQGLLVAPIRCRDIATNLQQWYSESLFFGSLRH